MTTECDQRASTPSPHSDPLVGVVLDGRYRVQGLVARGGMADVYRAQQIRVERAVAVKVLRASDPCDYAALTRFVTEASVMARLHHPNVLRLFDVGETADGRPYLVTELLEGRTLDQAIAGGPCDERWALGIARQVLSALIESHREGIIHRDIKPENIFLERAGDDELVRVLDFGIARVGDTDPLHLKNTVIGTPAYMPPEVASGDRATTQSDLYSLGVVLYEALAGRRPFDARHPRELMIDHVCERPPSIQSVGERAVSPDVETLVMALLEKKPRRRPAGAREARDWIDRILRDYAQAVSERRVSEPHHGPLAIALLVGALSSAVAWTAAERFQQHPGGPPAAVLTR